MRACEFTLGASANRPLRTSLDAHPSARHLGDPIAPPPTRRPRHLRRRSHPSYRRRPRRRSSNWTRTRGSSRPTTRRTTHCPRRPPREIHSVPKTRRDPRRCARRPTRVRPTTPSRDRTAQPRQQPLRHLHNLDRPDGAPIRSAGRLHHRDPVGLGPANVQLEPAQVVTQLRSRGHQRHPGHQHHPDDPHREPHHQQHQRQRPTEGSGQQHDRADEHGQHTEEQHRDHGDTPADRPRPPQPCLRHSPAERRLERRDLLAELLVLPRQHPHRTRHPADGEIEGAGGRRREGWRQAVRFTSQENSSSPLLVPEAGRVVCAGCR